MAIAMMANLLSSDGTTAQAGLGDTFETGGATYRYFKASGALAKYDCALATNGFLAAKATTTLSGVKPTLACIPQFAVADAEYFWAPVGPFQLREDGVTAFRVNALALCAASVKIYTTATDGSVDDTATDLIAGLCLTETLVGAGPANCIAVQTMVTNCQD